MKRVFGALMTGTLLLVRASSARADDFVSTEDTAHPEEPTPAFAASRASALVTVWPQRERTVAVFGNELSLRVASQAFLDLSYVAALASGPDVSQLRATSVTFGNPTIGGHFADAMMPNLHYFLGGSVTAPVLRDEAAIESDAGYFGARIDGYYNADRFSRDHLAIRAAAGLEWHAAAPLFVRVELRPVVYLAMSDRFPAITPTRGSGLSARRGATFVLEHAIEIEARSSMGFGVGARLQGVTMPMADDVEQETVEPYVAYSPMRKGAFARVGMPIGLDHDLGLGFDRGKLAAVKVLFGGQW